MRRTRLLQALLLSLALHGALALVVSLAPAPPPDSTPRSREVLQIEVFEHPRPSTPPAATPEPPPPPRRPPPPAHAGASPTRSPPRAPAAVVPPVAVTPVTPPPAPEPPAAAAPAPPDSPRAVRLYPGPGGLAVSPNLGQPSGTPSGHTWRPGDGPTPGQQLEEERERVHGRVQGFVEDELATGTVENGLADTFFGDMHRAMDKGLTGSPLFTYQGVLKHFFKPGAQTAQSFQSLFTDAGRYGAMGALNPNNGPTGMSLDEAARSGNLGARVRAQPSQVEVLDARSRAARALHAELELEQSRTGQVLAVKLVVSSGNPLFDAYVLENVPKSLAALGEAPEHFAAHTKKERIRSAWSVDGFVSFKRLIKVSKLDQMDASDAAYLSALVPLGILSGTFDETRGEIFVPDIRRPHFETSTRLLRVY